MRRMSPGSVREEPVQVLRGGCVSRYKTSLFTAVGALALSAGISVQLWMHGNYAHFVGGFLLGMSIALLILGLARPSRKVSRW